MITLNLLPDLVLQRRRDAQTKRLALIGVASWGALVFVVILGVLGYEFFQKATLAKALSTKAELNKTVNSDDNKAFRAEALEVQTSLKALDTLFNQQVKMSTINIRLAELTPKTVVLRSVDIANSRKLSLSGTAASYDEVGKFIVALKKISEKNKDTKIYFTDVKLESANLADKGSVKFGISAVYNIPPDSTIGSAK